MNSICHQCGGPLDSKAVPDNHCPACLWGALPNESATLPHAASEFPRVDGHEILEELARGGMGVVYRARQLDPLREVAIKMLLPGDTQRPDLRERFRVEVRSLAELDHPDILPLYQVGESDGRPWFSMKLANGGSLATRLRSNKQPMSPTAAASMIADLAEAVHYAHSHGILHRDIKPGNVLFDDRNTAFLADFGLAKLLDAHSDMTRSGALMGTPCYMAPEVAIDGARAATVASDVYGLGALFYELLSGRPPFLVEGMAALVRKIVDEEPERPSTLVDHIPRDLELVCLTCLAKAPGHRYASASALADDIRRWQRGEPVAARRAGLAARVWSLAKRRPALAAVSAAFALTLVGSSTWLAIAHSSLRAALVELQQSRNRADAQSDFLIGEFADSLETVGRLDLIEAACLKAADMPEPTDDAGRRRLARLHLRWGAVTWARGRSSEAAEKFHRAQWLADDILRRNGGDAEALALALSARTRLAEVLADSTSFDQAMRLLDEASASVETSRALSLDEGLRWRAEIDRSRATIVTNLRRDADALTEAGRASESFRAWLGRAPRDPVRRLAWIAALQQEGHAALNRAQFVPPGAEQRALFERSLALFRLGQSEAESLLADSGPLPAAEYQRAQQAGGVGVVLSLLGPEHQEDALAFLKLDQEIMAGLVAQDPKNWRWQFKLSDADAALARHYAALGQSDLARTHRERRLQRLALIAKEDPKVREWELARLNAMIEKAQEALDRQDVQSASQSFDEATRGGMRLVERQPVSRTEQDGWRNLTYAVAESWRRAGYPDRAAEAYTKAIEAARNHSQSGPAAPWWRWTSGHLGRRLAELRRQSGDLEGALEANRAALADRSHALRVHALGALEDPGAVAHSFRKTETCLLDMDRHREALDTAAEALALFIECRAIAGKPIHWAEPLQHVIEACRKAGHPNVEDIRALARQAASGFYPNEMRTTMDKADRDVLSFLLAAAEAPGTPAP